MGRKLRMTLNAVRDARKLCVEKSRMPGRSRKPGRVARGEEPHVGVRAEQLPAPTR